MPYIIGDTHVHAAHEKGSTIKAVQAAMRSGLDFIVFAYHSYTDRFDELQDIGKGYEVEDFGSIARITCKQHSLYAIKGEQITSDIDIIVWPIQEEIIPGDKKLDQILMQAKDQGAITVWSKPSRKRLWKLRKHPSEIMKYIDAVEYSQAPEFFVGQTNEYAKKLARNYQKPLIAGSDARLPRGILPCTGFPVTQDYFNIDKEQDFMAIIRNEFHKTALNRQILIVDNTVSFQYFMYQYAAYAAKALKKNPIGVLQSFAKSHR